MGEAAEMDGRTDVGRMPDEQILLIRSTAHVFRHLQEGIPVEARS